MAGEEGRHRGLGLAGNPEYAREVVAAAAGQDSQRGIGAGQRPADGPDQAVAAHHHRHLACFDRELSLLGTMLQARRALDPEVGAARVERLLDLWQQAQRLPARGGRVDQQRQWHPLDVHAFAA
jgi:hypothetical protein